MVLDRRRRVHRGWAFAAAVVLAGVAIGLVSLHEREEPPGAGRSANTPFGPEGRGTRELVPEPRPVARVELAEGAGALAVPVDAGNLDATIVFVYPVVPEEEGALE